MSSSVLSMTRPTTNGSSCATATTTATLLAQQLNAALANNGKSSTAAVSTTAPHPPQPKQPLLAAKIIKQSHVVCFDVDSTVICEEGIDELAEYCGKGSEVARVTKEAMGGSMTFQDALKIRLNIIRPTQQQVSDFIKQRPSTLSRNVKRFVAQLKADGKQVFLISGGFDCLIAPVAAELGIPLSNMYANKMLFDYKGDYDSFDVTQPTSRSGGKAEAIGMIRKRLSTTAAGDAPLMITMIGDGATDLEAVPPANNFIGFGGNVVRPEVYRRAQYYITDFEQLM
ncbi:phosphoserine phosphatase [Drosophila sulfurigaster albostrigata]|uniref:Phosphoserine phosphatase n=3 Tax=nasuta subgroup TaxID=32307 RepID=A0A6P8WIP2_DROAB|nr:phosphoserine phosphatase [Drosophila albomicans]XP_062128291.1 phosphoserine phosphatase [Drosophila sulfurigaster albostrigata]